MLGIDLPFANLSSETPDSDDFIADNYGFSWIVPPIGSNWSRNSCLGVCTSLISQADADTCAAIANLTCLVPDWGVCPDCDTNTGNGTSGPPIIPRTGVPGQVFYNRTTQCTALCPDGLPFTYQVAAGIFASTSQALADSMASSFACSLASRLKVCLGTVNVKACVGSFYQSVLTATSPTKVTFQIVGGSLPPGLSMGPNFVNDQEAFNQVKIDGIPTAGGNYDFTVRVVNTVGNFMQKTFTIRVMQITPTALPVAKYQQAYFNQMNVTGGIGPYTWSLAGPPAPLLPLGLTMDASGLVNGNAQAAGNFQFVAIVRDSTGQECQQGCSIQVVGVCNTAVNGTNACTGDPSKTASASVPADRYCQPPGGSQFIVDGQASADLINQLGAQLAAQGCACYWTVDYASRSVIVHGACAVIFDVRDYPSMTPIAPPHLFSVTAGTSPFNFSQAYKNLGLGFLNGQFAILPPSGPVIYFQYAGGP